MGDQPDFTTLDFQVNTMEKGKFKQNNAGEIVVRTSGDGTFTVVGAQVSILVEEIALTTSWTEITTSKTTRNALNIQNRSTAEDSGSVNVYIRHSSSGAPGVKIVPGGERQYAIANVAIYAKVASGSHSVTVEALA